MERIANVPGMWERTLTFGSGGKTFGVTGWRIGWIIGSAELIKPILAIQARTVFTTPTPLQDAVALGFEQGHKNGYFAQMRHDYQRRRDKAVAIFKELGLPVAIPHGSYFFMVDTKKIRVDLPPRSSEEVSDPTIMESRDYAICRWLTTEIGVTAIPPSAFYSPENTAMAANMIRICFCKTDETLDAAQDRLKKLLPYLK